MMFIKLTLIEVQLFCVTDSNYHSIVHV